MRQHRSIHETAYPKRIIRLCNTDYTTFGAGFSSHTLEVFLLLSFFRTHTTRTVTLPRAEIIRASASYSALTACASMSIPPVHCMRRTAEAEREAVS